MHFLPVGSGVTQPPDSENRVRITHFAGRSRRGGAERGLAARAQSPVALPRPSTSGGKNFHYLATVRKNRHHRRALAAPAATGPVDLADLAG
jgi:hypothetical protein